MEVLKVKAVLKLHGDFLSHFYNQFFIFTLLYLVIMVEMLINEIMLVIVSSFSVALHFKMLIKIRRLYMCVFLGGTHGTFGTCIDKILLLYRKHTSQAIKNLSQLLIIHMGHNGTHIK